MIHARALVPLLLVGALTAFDARSLAAWNTSLSAQRASSVSQTERVPDAAVVKGVPQGVFVGRSLLTGRAVCLLFLSGGRVTRAIPTGGLERFDWARHEAAHRGDAGRWQVAGGEIRITWGDSGVHQGALKETPDGIEFYGKRYARPAAVTVSALAGRWESTRGTAIAGGQGINATSLLVIQADGRYQRTGAIGGVVAGRAVADVQKANAGRIEIAGATLTLRADDGTATSFTFVPIAGTPVGAFSLDTDMFTRAQ